MPALDPLRIHFAHRLLRARDWQHRPEFDALCEWWRRGGVGVCALVGIGGAGKTAIADRFLRVAPGVMPDLPDLPKDDTLPPPERAFIFSFYDAPNPDSFFAQLAAWLQGEFYDESAKLPSYHQTLIWLRQAGSCLLVLDGLEKAQEDGTRGGVFGRIADGRLRDFVLRVAEGYVPNVAVIITTRFRPFSPLAEGSPYYLRITTAQLKPETAVALLRTRGVTRGTDDQLLAIARDQGFHALTVDLMGGYIARFCNGDPARLPPDPLGSQDDAAQADASLDPSIAALREQERKFARVAERYRDALAKSDPAALALLQRVCLFRLGVAAETLASIFLGKEKKDISGPKLAALSPEKLQAKLALLVEMKLLEATENEAGDAQSALYTIHPAVRDGFLKSLDAETARRGHDAAREGLEAALGERPGGANPSDPATLDLLEEIVYHTLKAGHVEDAYDIHRNRIGGYRNLGWRLGAYERGERICRAFAKGHPPQTAPLPEGLSEPRQVIFINEWAMYLKDLGRLDAAARCYERGNEPDYRRENWKGVSIGNQNLAHVLLLAGRLAAGLRVAEEALRLAERADDARRRDAHAYRAHARTLRGETAALADFDAALHWQHEADGRTEWPLYGPRGIQHTFSLARLGKGEEATRLTEANKSICTEHWTTDNPWAPDCNLLLADLAREYGDFADAKDLHQQAHDWAIARDAKEPLCWSALVRGRIALAEARQQDGFLHRPEASRLLAAARARIEEGLRIARDCGFGIYHIDLLTLRAQVSLHEGDAEAAERDARVALSEGVHPPEDSGLPELLAATDEECGYAWGEGDARHLLAEALLLQAAQTLGSATYKPRSKKTPVEVRELVKQAREQLNKCRRLRKRIQDPKIAQTETVLQSLKGGVLTTYPLESLRTGADEQQVEEKPMLTTSPGSVFISYAHKDNESPDLSKRWLDRLLEQLQPLVLQDDVAICSDQDIEMGDDWHAHIQTHLAAAKATVLLVSPAFLASTYIRNSELPVLLKKAKDQGLVIIPIILRPCLFKETKFKYPDPANGPEEFSLASLQAANSPQKALNGLSENEQDKVLLAVAQRLLKLAQLTSP